MARSTIVGLLFLLLLMVTSSCGKMRKWNTPAETVDGVAKHQNVPPGPPKVELKVTQISPVEAYVAVHFLTPSTDVENDKIAYTYKWYRNGEPMTFPTTQTDTVSKLGPHTNPDPIAVDVTDILWKVVVTPHDAYGTGATAEASTEFTLTRDCEWRQPGYLFVDCKGENIFSTNVTQTVTVASNYRIVALQDVIALQILGADGTPGHTRFRNFTDLMLRRSFSKSASEPLTFDPLTYQFTGDLGAIQFIDRGCMDIPLIGPVCLNGFLNEVDNEPGHPIIDFGPVALSRAALGPPVTEASPSENGTVIIESLNEHSFEVIVQLRATLINLFFEPPTDPLLYDIPNSAINYTPQMDLSSYLKAYGYAALENQYFELSFTVEVPVSFDHLDFVLRTVRTKGSDFQFILAKGPYCNNNLGTTEGLRPNSSERPFDSSGLANYPGLISDTVTGSQGSGALVNYYAFENWPYPHTASNTQGGSGVGRDRIGANAIPYAFDLAKGMLSDNPNNCAHPADACTVPGIQDGSPDFVGVSASCEYPNISNDGDDATYKNSEQITSLAPYIQAWVQYAFNHLY